MPELAVLFLAGVFLGIIIGSVMGFTKGFNACFDMFGHFVETDLKAEASQRQTASGRTGLADKQQEIN